MSVQIEGLEELEDQLEEWASTFEGEHDIPIEELFTDGFIATNTEFDTISGFFNQSPWEVTSEADLQKIDEDDLDRYVNKHTGFSSWEAMLSTAAREWLVREFSL